MIYNKLRISTRLILLALSTAFLHLHATAQQKTARYDLVLKSNKTTTSVLPAVRNSKLKAKFENEIHVKTREYTAKKMFETPTLAIANRPSRSIHNITSPGDTLFFEDFQSSVWPASMPRVNRDGKVVDAALAVLNFGTNAWIASPQSAGPGNTASLSTSYYAPVSQADDWMITPAVTITANNLLRWKARSIDPNPAFHDGYEVRICTNCPATFTNANVLTSFSTVLFSIDAELRGNAAIFEYQQRQLDLATYVGQTVRIAFRNNSDDKFLLSLDDIFIGKELAIDAQLTGLTALFSNQCTLGANESVKVKVSNKGSLPIASAPITVKVNGVQEGLGTITDLAPDETDSLTISGLDLSAIGAYEIEASVNVIDDGNAGNNTAAGTTQKVAPISLATTYQQSFETGDNLDNWIILDNNSDGASWVNFQTPQSGAEGTTGYMGYASLNPIPSDGDDWMITSCFTAEANVKYQFSFYERANGAINHTISLMAGTGQNPTDLTKTLYSGTDFIDDFDNWYQISDTFSLPATGIYYFGAHATSPAGTGRFRLDELKFRVSPAKDAKMEGVLFPTAAAYLCGSSSQQLAYIIKNDGSDVLTNIPVTLSLTGAATQTITMTVPTLAPGQTDTVLFTGTIDISNPGNYTASIYSSYVGDADISNDTTESNFTVSASTSYPLEDDFEALTGQFDLPEGWWSDEFGAVTGFGVDGSIGLVGNVFVGDPSGDVLEANLISPKIETVDPNGNLTFKYRLMEFANPPTIAYVMDPGDSILILASKNCGPFVKIHQITSSDHEASTEFAKIIVPLSSLNIGATDVVSLLIQLKHNGVAGDFLMQIDEFGVKTITPFDLKLVEAKLPILSKMKLKQADAITLGGSVSNEGLQDFGQWRLVATVTPGTFADSATLNSLAAGVTQQVNTPNPFTPTQTGLYTINYMAKSVSASQAEVDLTNNILSGEVEITDSTMGRDVGESTIPLGYGPTYAGRRIMGQTYRLKVADTLTSISFWVDAITSDVSAKGYYCRTNNTSGNPTPITGQDSTSTELTITTDEAFNWHTISFKKPNLPKGRPMLANTRYFFGIIGTDGDLRIGFNNENYESGTSFAFFNGTFMSTVDLLAQGAGNFFLRPNFGRLITTATQSPIEMSLSNADLFPNPASQSVKLAINLNKPSAVQVSIFNLTGKQLSTQSFDASQGRNALALPTEGLSKGVYLVKINAQGFTSTKKLVVE